MTTVQYGIHTIEFRDSLMGVAGFRHDTYFQLMQSNPQGTERAVRIIKLVRASIQQAFPLPTTLLVGSSLSDTSRSWREYQGDKVSKVRSRE